jgi:hypothetical protein
MRAPSKLHRSFALLRMTRHKLGGTQATQVLYNRLGLKEKQFERCCLISTIMRWVEKVDPRSRMALSYR